MQAFQTIPHHCSIKCPLYICACKILTHAFLLFFFFLLAAFFILNTHMHPDAVWVNVTSPLNVMNCSQLYLIPPALTVLLWTWPPPLSALAGADRSPSSRCHSPFIFCFSPHRLSLHLSVCLSWTSVSATSRASFDQSSHLQSLFTSFCFCSIFPSFLSLRTGFPSRSH